jgi:hypothetical protein
VLTVASLIVAGCFRSPAAFLPAAGDDRAVLAEFCSSWEPACQRYEAEVLGDPAVKEAVKRVRFTKASSGPAAADCSTSEGCNTVATRFAGS